MVKGNYLKVMPECYGEREMTGTGTYVFEGGLWKCTFHGTTDRIDLEIQEYNSLPNILRRGINRFAPSALIFIPLYVD
ncbi:MAG: hypothetical protein HQM09_25045 [Candidatus Riflebacteria bacterium]|nr:hypothetical protein [Candidatus Riflebacteria bacterium]